MAVLGFLGVVAGDFDLFSDFADTDLDLDRDRLVEEEELRAPLLFFPDFSDDLDLLVDVDRSVDEDRLREEVLDVPLRAKMDYFRKYILHFAKTQTAMEVPT